jgi:iron(III) transport system substrate-binding protein
MRVLRTTSTLALVVSTAFSTAAFAEGEVNLYSSRHYDTDERLYSDFTEATGITINRIEGNADELIARMQAEGANSPADILLTVDTSRLERAKAAGVLQSIDSDILEARIPDSLQDDDNQWFGFSQRARIIFYDKNDVATRLWITCPWPIRNIKDLCATGLRQTSIRRHCSAL